MVETAPPGEAEIVGTAVAGSPLAADAPVRIPVERYISAGFAELEHERLWPRVWHVACAVDHVADPGDWFEHRLGRYSILLVRGDDGELRGFQNVCRHRGNTICAGSGSGASELRCPYHRWAWDLAGRLREVPSRRSFGPLRNDELPLVPVRVGTWARLVFVSLDLDAEPLDGWLEGVGDDIATLGVDLSGYDTAQITGLSQYNLFPNATVLVSADLFTVMTARPGPSPDEAELVVIQLNRVSSADAPPSSPVHVTVPVDQADFGFVLNQDLSVIRTMQTGLHQPGATHVVLSAEECRIINMNRHLERYLGLDPGATEPAPAP